MEHIHETPQLEKRTTDNNPWQSLLTASQYLTEPCVIPEAISEEVIESLRHVTEEVMEQLLSDSEARMRVWVNRMVSKEYLEKIRISNFSPKDGLVEWSKRVFEDKKFGIIVNDCEKYSDQLNDTVLCLIAPLLERIGIPTLGIDFTYFIGNYGYTPIGYHVDPPGDSVIHLHLGPGPKKMYLVRTEDEKKDYYSKRKDDTTLYVDPIAFEGKVTEYSIKAGDLFYMPPGEIHVGKSDEVSVGFTIWLRSGTVGTVYEKLFDRLLRKAVKHNHQGFFPFIKQLGTVPELSGSLKASSWLGDTIDLSTPLDKLIRNELIEHQYETLSNGGLAIKPSTLNSTVKDIIHKNVTVISPYKMLHLRVNDDLMKLFTRGYIIYVPYSLEFINTLELINQGRTFSVEQIVTFLADWGEDLTLYTLHQMHRHQGIKIA